MLHEIVGSGRARVERAARHSKHLSALLSGQEHCDQRARPAGALNHQTPSEIPEIRRLRRGKSLPRGEKPGARSLTRSPCSRAMQLLVLWRVDIVDTAGKHGDGAARKCGKVSCGIDATGEARGDDEAFMSEIGCKRAGEFLTNRCGLRRWPGR